MIILILIVQIKAEFTIISVRNEIYNHFVFDIILIIQLLDTECGLCRDYESS